MPGRLGRGVAAAAPAQMEAPELRTHPMARGHFVPVCTLGPCNSTHGCTDSGVSQMLQSQMLRCNAEHGRRHFPWQDQALPFARSLGPGTVGSQKQALSPRVAQVCPGCLLPSPRCWDCCSSCRMPPNLQMPQTPQSFSVKNRAPL